MTTPRLPEKLSWRVPLVDAKGMASHPRGYELFSSIQHWTSQTAVLDAGVQAQISDVRYTIEDVRSEALSARAEIAVARADSEAVRREAVALAQQALLQALARQDGRFTQEISEVYALVAGLEQQVALMRSDTERLKSQAQDRPEAFSPVLSTLTASGITRIGTVEQRLDNLNTDAVPEGAVNKYYTDARARLALSGTAPVSYNNSTGAISLNASLTSLGAVTTAADKGYYTTALNTWASADLSSFGRSVWNLADATAGRTLFGLGTMATQAASAVAITGGTALGLGGVQITSNTTTGSGSGLELLGGASGVIQAYNRTGAAYIQLTFDGLQLNFRTSGANRFIVSSTGANVSSGDLTLSSAGKIGYATGSGGTVTQITSKATGVTLNKTNGAITLSNAALAASGSAAFVLTNSTIAATDTVLVSIKSGATSNAYNVQVEAVAAGSCTISIFNRSGGSLSEAVVLNFAVLKAVTS